MTTNFNSVSSSTFFIDTSGNINANGINIMNKFTVDTSGNINAYNLYLKGTITDISNNFTVDTSGNINANGINIMNKFTVDTSGNINANNLYLKGGITDISNNFTVDTIGNINANNLNLTGSLSITNTPYFFLKRITSLIIPKCIVTNIYFDAIEFNDTYLNYNNIKNLIIDSSLNKISNQILLYYNDISNIINTCTPKQLQQDNLGNITVPSNGYYTIEAQVSFTNSNNCNSGEIILTLNKQNIPYIYSRIWKNFLISETNTLNFSITIKLLTTDIINISLQQSVCDLLYTGILYNNCWCIIRKVY